ncbi:Hypothetical predicted protein [Olea europaea subsp. europaea]|uniref:Uncharacterized protein n=1 Tax=Olea europaea subsp. europaea TaxID=158383 RepID=A0A8S0SQV8_OLEEU|nr:Hypothetical predicted protein [Olea europaea subsp. europaea]
MFLTTRVSRSLSCRSLVVIHFCQLHDAKSTVGSSVEILVVGVPKFWATGVSAFRTHLETLIASPVDHEATIILRDKLIFLHDMLYAKCISVDEYDASKRPLLLRLAI